MADLKIEQLKVILNEHDAIVDQYGDLDFHNFVETGTLVGNTVFGLQPYFTNLYSIEIKPEFYQLCVNASAEKEITNIHFYNGDSSKILHQVLEVLDGPTIFFLDAHFSHDNTGRGEKDVPLLEEISLIDQLHKHQSIIIVDDARLFGTNLDEDWTEITTDNIERCFRDGRIFATTQIQDRYNIFLNEVID